MRRACRNSGVVFALSHKEQVALHILLEDEQGFGFAAYLNPSALAYGKKVGAVVLPDTNSIFWIPVHRH